MPQRQVPLVAGEYYHIYNRGNNRQRIFFARENYLFFLRRVREYLMDQTSEVPETSDVFHASGTIVAYCLMPNHFHLLLAPCDDALSRRMQRLLISYTKAMNERYQRTGSLFEGQFQAARVDNDEYLLHLSRYIHLNPVLAGLVLRPQDWEFSSYREFIGVRSGTLPCPELVLAQLGGPADYRAFVEAYQPRDRDKIAGLQFDE